MHAFTGYYEVHHVTHPSLRHHSPKCLDPFFELVSGLCWCIGQRYVVTIMTMLGIAIQYMQRICLSIMITEMVQVTSKENEASSNSCPEVSKAKDIGKGSFDWSVTLQGDILASFFYGYLITHIPGGIIADIFGGKHIFGMTVLITSISTALTPILSKAHPLALLAIRIVMGLAQGPLFPSVTSLVAHWAPPMERSLLNTLTNSGVPLGLVMGNLLSGVFLHAFPPWDNVFYIYAVMGGVWYIIWFIFISPTPSNHPFIKDTERDYILDSIHSQSKEPSGKIPWKQMLSSKYFWMICFANLGHEWGLFFVATELPIYMASVQRLPIELNGIASSVPWACMWLGTLLSGQIATLLEKRNICSKVFIRKLFTIIANVIPAGVMIVTLFIGCEYISAVVVMSFSTFLIGSVFVGVRCSSLDITPNFAGIAMSFISGVAGLAGLGIPKFVQTVIGQGTNVSDWNWPIYVTSGFMVVSTIPYLLFITTEVQPWNEGSPRTSKSSIGPKKPQKEPTSDA